LAGAAAGRDPLRGLVGQFRFESHPLGQRRLCDSGGTNGASRRQRERSGKARGKRASILGLQIVDSVQTHDFQCFAWYCLGLFVVAFGGLSVVVSENLPGSTRYSFFSRRRVPWGGRSLKNPIPREQNGYQIRSAAARPCRCI
jgi:hypothetical protein